MAKQRVVILGPDTDDHLYHEKAEMADLDVEFIQESPQSEGEAIEAVRGADAIMIHSKEETPQELFQFCAEYRNLEYRVPLVAVPTTYNIVTEEQLMESGVQVVIYANHLLRSAYPGMRKVAESILQHGRANEAEEHCLPIADCLALISQTSSDNG